MKKMLFTVSTTILLGIYLPKAHAQDGLQNLWISGGAGFGGKGVAADLKLSCEVANQTFLIRYLASQEMRPLFSNGSTPLESIQDISLLYGIAGDRSRFGFFNASVGLGWVSGHHRGKFLYTESLWFFGSYDVYEDVGFSTPGIALDIETGFTPFSFVGVGLNLIGNLNAENSYIGFLLSIQLGKVN